MGDVERSGEEVARGPRMTRRLGLLRQAERGGRGDAVAVEQRQRMLDVDEVGVEQGDLDDVESVTGAFADASLGAFARLDRSPEAGMHTEADHGWAPW